MDTRPSIYLLFQMSQNTCMRIINKIDDNRISATNLLIETTLGEYESLAATILQENPFQRKRVKTAGTIYSLLKLAQELLQGALFGTSRIFSTELGSKNHVEQDSLLLQQEEGADMIRLDPQGGLVCRLQLPQTRTGLVVIKEQLERQIVSALKYSAWVLEKIDPTQRLTQSPSVSRRFHMYLLLLWADKYY